MPQPAPGNKPVTSCASHVYEAPCFSLLTKDETDLLDSKAVTVTYRKGETICKQGTFASNIVYLEKGLVKVYLEGTPKNLILTLTPPGNIIGVPSLFEGNNKFLYSVTTYIESVVKMIDISIFRQLLLQNSAFAFRILNLMNENTAQMYDRFFCLTQKNLHGRLADILLCLSNRIFKSTEFDLPISRNDLGELSSMSTESVIRLMKEMKEDGLIEISGKTIKLINVPRLIKISELG